MVQQDLPEKLFIAHRIDGRMFTASLQFVFARSGGRSGKVWALGKKRESRDLNAWHCSEVNARLAPKNGLSSGISCRLSFHLIQKII